MDDDHADPGEDALSCLAKERRRYEFLKGPVPWGWLRAAMSTRSHAALCLALAIWHQATCERATTFKLRRRWAAEQGISPQGTRDALRRLQTAGIVRVHFFRGANRRPEITVLQPS